MTILNQFIANHSYELLFYGFSLNIIGCVTVTVFGFSTIASLGALILAFVNAACLCFLLELEFIALLILIIYVGAIAILFLFSVMMFNLKKVVRSSSSHILYGFSLMYFGLWCKLILDGEKYTSGSELFEILGKKIRITSNSSTNVSTFNYNPNYYESILPNLGNEVYVLGQLIYTNFLVYLVLTGVILLVAMIGAIVLINNPRDHSEMQHSNRQLSRKAENTFTELK